MSSVFSNEYQFSVTVYTNLPKIYVSISTVGGIQCGLHLTVKEAEALVSQIQQNLPEAKSHEKTIPPRP